MIGPTYEFIVWLVLFRYSFQKIISYFSYSKQDFENN